MLNLAAPTPADWARRMAGQMDEILLDHAHCEKKAASTAVSLLFRYPEYPQLALPLSRLAREELAHFELVVGIMRDRGIEVRRQRPSPYAAALMEAVRSEEPHRLLDTLLCCALIEARSCERMRLLAGALEDPVLVDLYQGLLASEARHHATYVDLARDCGLTDEATLKSRLAELARHEAAVLDRPAELPRMHAGILPA